VEASVNVEPAFTMTSPEEAEPLGNAFIQADELMRRPVRFCPIRAPFSTDILIISPLPD
jgi:hypothetical protein